MKNALIIPSSKDRAQNNWPSLQMIGRGLEDTYSSCLDEEIKIEAPYSGNLPDLGIFKEAISKLPDQSCLIFPYAIPKQVSLINPLLPLIHKKNLQCKVHLYGDFFQQWPEWKEMLERMAQGHFSAAALSSRFSQIIARTLNSKQGISVLVPRLNLSPFAFNETHRQQIRTNMNLKADEILILTVSRINDRKGFFRNYEIVKGLSKRHKVRWIVAGDFDDWNLPYAGEVFPAGYTFSAVTQFLKSQKPGFKIDFLGHVEPSEVADLTQAADLFLHRSRSFEEDFSLAGREAIANGLPCLFENWGPFADLDSYENVALQNQSLSSLLGYSLQKRKSLSQAAIDRMKSVDQKRFLNFLVSSTSFDAKKIKPLEVNQFAQIMDGSHE